LFSRWWRAAELVNVDVSVPPVCFVARTNVHQEIEIRLPAASDLPFGSDYAIRRVQVNQEGLELNGTRQLLVYVDDVNMLGGSAHYVKENTGA
jgi:hypothetical protein